ncbi:hypothetical protein CTEN210_01009 [Chaetoceros tenuissimus]|uniref:Uncharacterized protein n=1 Tax=Chaetoceros tenuissimus TaxID=426638 RepID=A0AAD3CH60_9STRA|nr:hypothetical protein CTEN210_01009 [Chaetoceros tenuissimus]
MGQLLVLIINNHEKEYYTKPSLAFSPAIQSRKEATAALTMKLLFLNETTPEKLNQAHQQFLSSTSTSKLEGIFDVITISSKFNLEFPMTQHETFMQHPSVRNFIIATEDDDPDPTCYNTTTISDVEKISTRCSNRYKYWQNRNAYNRLTHMLSRGFASMKFLKEKKNPAGWICAQKRFQASFTKYMELLQKSNAAIPDYLMIIDGDTYMNMNHLYTYFISNSDEDGYVPKSSTPVMFAGCRTRFSAHRFRLGLPFGGFGVYLSRGALKKWMMPIHCNDTKTLEHKELCRRYTSIPPNLETHDVSVTIGEGKFFRNGMSLNELFKEHIHQEDTYCLHGDWFFGYIANYLNISRHVVPKGELPNVGFGGQSAMFYDGTDRKNAVEGVDYDYEKNRTVSWNRLHTIMGSEMYKFPEGLCLYGNGMDKDDNDLGLHKEIHFYIPVNKSMARRDRQNLGWKTSQECVYNATICHYLKNPDHMKRLYEEAESQKIKSFK